MNKFTAELNHWCVNQLTEEQISFLKSLPEVTTLNIADLSEILILHGSPCSDEETIRIDTPENEIRNMIENVTQAIVGCGHTHIQFDRSIGNKRLINAGSVGLQSLAHRACWSLLGPNVEFKVTTYDKKEAIERILKSDAPYKKEFAEHYLNPPNDGP